MEKKDEFYLSIDKKRLEICYLFMAADGEITANELNYFNEIGKCYSNFKDEKNDIIDYCESVLKSGYEPFAAIKKIVKNETLNITREKTTFLENLNFFSGHFFSVANKENAGLLWLLINLGYVDGDYSESEHEIISFIAQQCKFSEDILIEFEDIASTLEILENYKHELENQTLPYSYVKKILFFKIKKTRKGKSKEEINKELEKIENDKQKVIESLFMLINEWE